MGDCGDEEIGRIGDLVTGRRGDGDKR